MNANGKVVAIQKSHYDNKHRDIQFSAGISFAEYLELETKAHST